MKLITEDKNNIILSSIFIYGILVSFLYSFGYWSTFNINILQFAALSDILRLAIYPIFISAVLGSVGILFNIVFQLESFKKEPDKVFIYISKRYIPWLNAIIAIIIFTLIIWRQDGKSFVYAGILLSVIIRINFGDLIFLKSIIPNPGFRGIISYLLLIFLLSSFGWGKQDAEKILSGKSSKNVSTAIFKDESSNDFKSKKILEDYSTLKFLGTTGEYFLFLSPDNKRTIIVKYENLHLLKFNLE